MPDDLTKQRMAERKNESKPSVTTFSMADRKSTWPQPPRQTQPHTRQSDKVMIAAKVQAQCIGIHSKRDTKPATQIFLQPRRSSETLAAINNLRKPPDPPIHPRPDLPASSSIFGHGHNRRNRNIVMQRQRPADQPAKLREKKTKTCPPAFNDFARVSHRRAGFQPPAEPLTHCRRKTRPRRAVQQRAIARVWPFLLHR